MRKIAGISLLLAAAGVGHAQAETFVLQSVKAGHVATLKIPVGAVTKLSADHAESLDGYGDAQGETMRLQGDVIISIAGSLQPIEIKADTVVLELTADSIPGADKSRRADSASHKVLRSTITPAGEQDSQVFLGNVVFDLQTPSGPMEIKADKVEHQLRAEEGA
jgi:lipopolysaccharide export system protein LptA